MSKTCPFMGKACEYHDCAMWSSTAGSCAITVIAEEMRSAGASADLIADGVAEIAQHTTPTIPIGLGKQ